MIVLGCSRRDSVAPAALDPVALNAELRGQVLLVPSVSAPVWASDPLAVSGLAIDGDTLRAAVTYGGGCRRHALQPIAETVWMESYPVQVHARIAHNADRDPCDALVTRLLHIDLTPLRDAYRRSYRATRGRIALRLAGAREVPVYEF
jgi:hypothetical protein